MIIVSMLPLRLQDLLTFFVIAYLIALLQSSLLYINVSCGLLWSMPVQFGFSIQFRILILWTVFSSKLLIGLLVAGGIHPHTVRESLQLIVQERVELAFFSSVSCHKRGKFHRAKFSWFLRSFREAQKFFLRIFCSYY